MNNRYYSYSKTHPLAYQYGLGDALKTWVGNNNAATSGWFKGLGNSIKSGLKANGYGIADTAINIGGKLINPKGNTSKAGNILDAAGTAVSFIPGWGQVASLALRGAGKLVNAAWGSNLNQEAINGLKSDLTDAQNSIGSSLNWNALADNVGLLSGIDVEGTDIGSQGWFSHAVDNARDELRDKEAQAQGAIGYAKDNVSSLELRDMMGNALAFGGPIFKTDYDMGLSFINTGGTHESNPYGGVTVGIAPDGLPNQVEEDEVIFNDYVFSNRLKVPKAIRNKYRLRKVKDLSFADALKQYIRKNGIEERNNDPIANRGLDAFASELAMEQEMLKAKRQMRKRHGFADGGHIYSGEQDGSSRLYSTGTYTGKGNPWMSYVAPAVEDYFNNALAEYYKQKTPKERAAFAQDFMNRVNGLQDSYYGIVNSPFGSKSDAIGAHQTMFSNMGGNNYFDDFDSNIRKGYKIVTTDNAANNFAPDSVMGPQTYERNFGTNSPESQEFNSRMANMMKLMGLNWAPEKRTFGDNGRSLYKLSLANNDLNLPNNEPSFDDNYSIDEDALTNDILSGIGYNSNGTLIDKDGDLQRGNVYYDPRTRRLEKASLNANLAGLGYNLFDPWRPKKVSTSSPSRAISAPHIGDYLEYTPYDINYATSQQDANSAATRNAIMQSALPGRDNLLLANDFNNNATRGATRRQALEYNDNARRVVADFNRGTNQFNAQMDLQTAARNQDNRRAYDEMGMRGGMFNSQIDMQDKMYRDQAIGSGIRAIADWYDAIRRDDMARRGAELYASTMPTRNEAAEDYAQAAGRDYDYTSWWPFNYRRYRRF